MKKINFKLLAMLMMVSSSALLTGCKDNNQQPKEEAKVNCIVWAAPSTVKYMLDDEPVLNDNFYIDMAQNEYESIQLIATPQENIRSYDMKVSDLKSSEGNTISKGNIELFVEKYIDVSVSTTNFRTGYYPDAIVPLDKIKEYKEDLIKKDQNQAFLITVKTDENTPAGTYKGVVELTLNDKKISKELTVRVRDFAISSNSHTKISFGFWTDMFMYQCNEVTTETIENYLDLCAKYRISSAPGKVGNLTFDEMVDKYAEWLSKPGVSCLGMPYTITTGTTPSGKSYSTFNKDYMKKFLTKLARLSTNENNMIAKLEFSFSTYDEPKASQYEFVSCVSRDFQLIKNEIAADETIFAPGVKDEVKEAMKKIPDVTTLVAGYTEALARDYNNGDYMGVDTWCTQFDYYDSALNRYNIGEQIAKGDGAWFYGCVSPKNPYPTYHIDDNLLSARLLDWMMMEYGITGKLNWGLNIWATYDGMYTYRDVWNDFSAYPGSAGDGYVLYPGTRYGMNNGIATIRMEAIRDGMEDYEALYVLRNLNEELAKKYAVPNYDFNESISNLYRILYNGTISTNNIKGFAKVKDQIFSLTEFAKKGMLLDYKVNYATGKIDTKVYTDNNIKDVKAENASLTPVQTDYGKVWQGSLYSDKYLDIEASNDTSTITLSRYVGGGAINMAALNNQNDIDAITPSDFNEFDGIEDTKISLTDVSEYGKGLKIVSTPVDSKSYNSSITIPVNANLEGAEGIRLFASNPQNKPVSISISIVDKSGKKSTLSPNIVKPNANEEIWYSIIPEKSFDYSSVTKVIITLSPTEGIEGAYELYIDNVAFMRGGLTND